MTRVRVTMLVLAFLAGLGGFLVGRTIYRMGYDAGWRDAWQSVIDRYGANDQVWQTPKSVPPAPRR